MATTQGGSGDRDADAGIRLLSAALALAALQVCEAAVYSLYGPLALVGPAEARPWILRVGSEEGQVDERHRRANLDRAERATAVPPLQRYLPPPLPLQPAEPLLL